MLEILKLLLALLPELLPIILELLDKDSSERATVLPEYEAMFRAAMRQNDCWGMLFFQMACCICNWSDEKCSRVRGRIERIEAILQKEGEE